MDLRKIPVDADPFENDKEYLRHLKIKKAAFICHPFSNCLFFIQEKHQNKRQVQ